MTCKSHKTERGVKVPKDTFYNLNEEKQEKIMRSAINEFSDKGYEKGNIGEIAKKARVAKGSMYQYFDNKKELFIFSVHWAMDFFMKKYYTSDISKYKGANVFEYFYRGAKEMWVQLRDESEIRLFIEDVFLGRYGNMTDESMDYIMKVSDEFMLALIQDNKKNGYIRKDIDDNTVLLFMIGAVTRFKQYYMHKARSAGKDIVDEDFEEYEKEIKEIIELLKNGMGA